MKSILNILVLIILVTGTSHAQILSTQIVDEGGASNSLSFLDGSSSPSYNGFNSAGKGLLFPRIDLTTLSTTDIFDAGSIGQANYNPNYYDGLVVYNTTAGAQTTTDPMGSVADDNFVEGFYYYQNTSGTLGGGTWLPFGGDGSSSKTEVENNTIKETTTIINGTPVNVIRLPGSTNGTSTEMDLGTSDLPANSVLELREALIYDASGKLLLTATSDYDSATNVFTTGDGMVNKLLPAATDYVVELYFVPTVAP